MKKRSEQIREAIGGLIYEQQLFQQAENDSAIDVVQERIDKLRSQLLSVEEDEKKIHSDIEDHG